MKPRRVELDLKTPVGPRPVVNGFGGVRQIMARHAVHAEALGLKRDSTVGVMGEEYRFRALVKVSPAHRHLVPIDAWVSSELAWVPCLYALNHAATEEWRAAGSPQWLADVGGTRH